MNFRREVILVNKRIRCRDVFPSDGLFLDVAKALWTKYKDTLTAYGEENVENLIAEQDRMPLRFQYIDASGSHCLIEPSEAVETILDNGANQVIWDHVPVGGVLDFRQIFSQHASDLFSLPEFAHWKCVFGSSPKYGIMATSTDKNGLLRTLKITPSGKYPTTPPTVVAEPGFDDDPRWSDGILHFASLPENGGFIWEKRVTDNSSDTNPLRGLVQEVLQDYGFGNSPKQGRASGDQGVVEEKPVEKVVAKISSNEDSSKDTPQSEQVRQSDAASQKTTQQDGSAESNKLAKSEKTAQAEDPDKSGKTVKRKDDDMVTDEMPLHSAALTKEAKKSAAQPDDKSPSMEAVDQTPVADKSTRKAAAGISKKPLAIVIPDQVARGCLEQWQEAVRRRGRFIEQGGAIIGFFDGSRITVSDMLHDDEATATAAYIRLSFQVLDNAEQVAAERTKASNVPHYFVGTWHVHPPGFGNQLSQTDRTQLFQERMLIKSDEPFAEFPMVHLIFDGETLAPCAYSMVIKAKYSRQQLTDEKTRFELAEIVMQHADLGDDMGGLIATSSGWEGSQYYTMGTSSVHADPEDVKIGFWKGFPYKTIPATFEEVFMENFFRKVRVSRFLYCQYLAKRKRRERVESYLVERKGTKDLDAEVVDFVSIDIEYTSNRKQ